MTMRSGREYGEFARKIKDGRTRNNSYQSRKILGTLIEKNAERKGGVESISSRH